MIYIYKRYIYIRDIYKREREKGDRVNFLKSGYDFNLHHVEPSQSHAIV